MSMEDGIGIELARAAELYVKLLISGHDPDKSGQTEIFERYSKLPEPQARQFKEHVSLEKLFQEVCQLSPEEEEEIRKKFEDLDKKMGLNPPPPPAPPNPS